MKLFQKILAFGFAIAIIGWCIGVFLGQRELGISLFLVGFVSSVIGLIGSILKMDFSSEVKLRVPNIGLKLSTIGFGISCISVISNFIIDLGDVTGYIFTIGFVIVIIGISIMILGIRKNR